MNSDPWRLSLTGSTTYKSCCIDVPETSTSPSLDTHSIMSTTPESLEQLTTARLPTTKGSLDMSIPGWNTIVEAQPHMNILCVCVCVYVFVHHYSVLCLSSFIHYHLYVYMCVYRYSKYYCSVLYSLSHVCV